MCDFGTSDLSLFFFILEEVGSSLLYFNNMCSEARTISQI